MTQSTEPTSDPFAGVLAELRAPIVAIQGNMRALMTRDKAMTADTRQQLQQQVLQHSQRLDTLVDDIVLYLRLLMGPVQLTPEPVRVHEVVEELKERLGEPERVTNRVPRQLVLDIDRYALAGALRHLLRNALVYGARKRAVVVGVRRIDGTLELTVSDEGFGIPEAGLARAFEPFVRGVHPDEKRNVGAGLGLTVCRELVRLLGGDVELRPNAPGLSATIVLPYQG